jgi:hypothetical protein
LTIELPDGLEALRAELSVGEVMRLLERTARWVDPQTFRLLPIWYPEFARGVFFYKANWSEPQLNKSRQTGEIIHKREGNVHANKALTSALGLRSGDRPNWSCCHIWGVDDSSYQLSNSVVQDRRFFSCIANMVLLPTPLKAFTDYMKEVKAMLRICAYHLYGWQCEHESVSESVALINEWNDWQYYPESWPKNGRRNEPLGLIRLNDGIRASAANRLAGIRKDLKQAGKFYPREEVQRVLSHWKVVV